MNHREQWLAKREEEPAHSQSQSRFVDDIIKQQKRAVEIASQAVEALERSAWTRTRTRRIGFAALTVVAAIALCILRFLSDVVNWGLERIIATSIAEISVTTALLASTIWVPFERRNRVDLAVTWAFIIWTSFAMGFVGFDSVPPGNLSLFLLSGILFVYPTAFDVPYPHLRYSLFLLVAIIVAGIINFIILRIANFYSFINFILVLIIGVITIFPRRISYLSRQEMMHVYASLESESLTQLVLLQRVIPPVFLQELLTDERVVSTAERVAVLFCEVMRVTLDPATGEIRMKKLGANVEANALSTLSQVFNRLDAAVAAHGLHKVETIGSEYMAVSGLPAQSKHPRNGALAAIRAALQMVADIRKDPTLENVTLQIGINCGTVVEAILGRTLLPRWKLFGDTVNTASRMKSNGKPCRIHISHTVRREVLQEVRQVAQARLGEGYLAAVARALGSEGDRADVVDEFPSVASAVGEGHDGAESRESRTRVHVVEVDPNDRSDEGRVDAVLTPTDVITASLLNVAFVPRPRTWIKGKGVMQTFFVEPADKLFGAAAPAAPASSDGVTAAAAASAAWSSSSDGTATGRSSAAMRPRCLMTPEPLPELPPLYREAWTAANSLLSSRRWGFNGDDPTGSLDLDDQAVRWALLRQLLRLERAHGIKSVTLDQFAASIGVGEAKTDGSKVPGSGAGGHAPPKRSRGRVELLRKVARMVPDRGRPQPKNYIMRRAITRRAIGPEPSEPRAPVEGGSGDLALPPAAGGLVRGAAVSEGSASLASESLNAGQTRSRTGSMTGEVTTPTFGADGVPESPMLEGASRGRRSSFEGLGADPTAAAMNLASAGPVTPADSLVPTADLDPVSLSFLEENLETVYESHILSQQFVLVMAGSALFVTLCVGEFVVWLDERFAWAISALLLGLVTAGLWVAVMWPLAPFKAVSTHARFWTMQLSAGLLLLVICVLSGIDLLDDSASRIDTPENASAAFQFAGYHTVVMLLGPTVLTLHFYVFRILAPVLLAIHLGFLVSRWPEEAGYAVVWSSFLTVASMVLAYTEERHRRADFFVNHVASEGRRATESMLHSMLPKSMADRFLKNLAESLQSSTVNRLGFGASRSNVTAAVPSTPSSHPPIPRSPASRSAVVPTAGGPEVSEEAAPSAQAGRNITWLFHEYSAQPVALLQFDLVGFTSLSAKIGPHRVVTMLDRLYLEFDAIVHERGAYKVETIGDAFLVCCGVPERRPPHESALVIAHCGLDMIERVASFRVPGLPPLRARIGVHSGPVLAGVIGDSMPRYQLFGQAVDYSSEMESSSEPGEVHASADFLRALDSSPEFVAVRTRPDGSAFLRRAETVVTLVADGDDVGGGFRPDAASADAAGTDVVGTNVAGAGADARASSGPAAAMEGGGEGSDSVMPVSAADVGEDAVPCSEADGH